MQRPRHVNTRGGFTSEDLHELRIPAGSRAVPVPRLRIGVKGVDRCVMGTPTGGSDPREGVQSGGNHNIMPRQMYEAMRQVTL
jgi:hypothetical protein